MKLTPRQEAVLARLRSRDLDKEAAESGGEIADALWHTGLFTSREQGQRTCKQLVDKGLAVKLGFGAYNAQCYGPA